MKVKILKDYTNQYGRKLKKGYLVNMFSDDAIWAISKGFVIDEESDCKKHFIAEKKVIKKVKTKHKEDK